MTLSANYGIILSGLTGVGKSTLQNALIQAGCWSPRLLTSRAVDPSEGNIVEHVTAAELIGEVRAGRVVAPVIFAGNIYAWPFLDFQRLRSNPAGAVITTRPYTALLLAVAIPGLIPVWLDLSEEGRRQRLARRAATRDQDTALAEQRLTQDGEDVSYRELFAVRIISDGRALSALTELIEGKQRADAHDRD